MDIITPVSQAVSPFTDLGIVGIFALLCFVVVVGILWLGYKITTYDSRRDKSNSDLSEAQLKIMAAQQVDIANTNKVVADALINSARQFEEFSKNSAKLNMLLEGIQEVQSKESRNDFNSILDRFQAQESILLRMSEVVGVISKDFAEFRTSPSQCAIEWKNSVDSALTNVQSNIKDLVDKQKEKERKDYVEKELSDLMGLGI